MTSTHDDARTLQRLTGCPVYLPHDAGYAPEIAAFNTTVTHTPELVIAADSETAVVRAVRFARQRGRPVAVQGAGHGGHPIVRSGILVSTRALDHVAVDPAACTATVGAGARWGAVVAAAAQHGLAPVTGSSPLVGVAGFLLGGGLGPLARSHGFGSDYWLGARVVVESGDVITADAELMWALRGGKPAVGVVTELTLKLTPLRRLYAGRLYFEEQHIDAAFRAWIDWTATADPRVSTSAALSTFPPFETIPAALRGRRLMALRFAFPGAAEEGERLAAPLRGIAPVYLDALTDMPATDIAQIHNDPTQPNAVWVGGLLIDRVDPEFATAFLESFDPGRGSPFVAGELRHLGEATRRDVEGGSAAGGRGAGFVLGYIGLNPAQFERVLPQASDRIVERLSVWRSSESNINFMPPHLAPEQYANAWPPATVARLREIERKYDPSGMFKRVE